MKFLGSDKSWKPVVIILTFLFVLQLILNTRVYNVSIYTYRNIQAYYLQDGDKKLQNTNNLTFLNFSANSGLVHFFKQHLRFSHKEAVKLDSTVDKARLTVNIFSGSGHNRGKKIDSTMAMDATGINKSTKIKQALVTIAAKRSLLLASAVPTKITNSFEKDTSSNVSCTPLLGKEIKPFLFSTWLMQRTQDDLIYYIFLPKIRMNHNCFCKSSHNL